MPPAEAALEAARLRPIVMTSLAFILVASFFVPLFFVVIDSAGDLFRRTPGVPSAAGQKTAAPRSSG